MFNEQKTVFLFYEEKAVLILQEFPQVREVLPVLF